MHLDHVAIACRDVEHMRAWYEQVLNLKAIARKAPSRPDARETTYLVAPPGNQIALELMPDDRTAPPGRKPFTRGISHVAFCVEDLGEWEARLSTMGVRWLGEPVEAVGRGKLRSFLDPEDNMLQIVQR